MKNKKRFGFLSALLGICISTTSILGTVAFADGSAEGGEEQPIEVVYGVQENIADIVFAKNKVDYFTADGKTIDLTSKDYANFEIKVEFNGNDEYSGYTYSAGTIIYSEITDNKVYENEEDNTNKDDDYYLVRLINKDITEDNKEVACAEVKVVNATDIAGNAGYQVKYAVDDEKIEKFIADIETDVNKPSLNTTSPSIEIPSSFWNLLDLGVFESSQLVTKVYLAKPKTDFSVVNSSWKSDLSKLSLSSYGTYAFYVEVKDFYGNQIVVDKETMELRSDGWYLNDTDTLVIPVFSFDYIKEVIPTVEISAKQKTGIIGVEYNSGRLTTENVAKTTITLYYNENPDAKVTSVDDLTAAKGWKVATSEQATISGGKLSSSSLKFTPLVRGAYAYKVVAIGSDVDNTNISAVSEAISVTQAVQAQKLVNVKFRNFLKTNWLSLVFLGIAFLCVVGIVVLAFYNPKDADELAAKKAKKEKVEDAEEAVEAEEVEEAVEEVEEATEEVAEEATEEAVEAPAEEATEEVEAPAEEAPAEAEAPAEEAPADEAKPE